MKNGKRRLATTLSMAGVGALALTGCVGDMDPQAGEDVDCAAYEQYGTFEGEEVSIYATILDVEADRLNESWADFEACTGIDIAYEGSSEFETQINVRAQGGNAPDLAFFPQPGLLASMVEQGHLLPAPEEVEANVDEYWSEDWKGYGTVDGEFYAAPLMANIKGYVWYQPSFFTDNGYEVPATLDEMDDLTAQIASDGFMPWCVGFGSGEATGWPGTDWVEDYVLRLHGPEVYDQWINHEIPFDDPQIVEALGRVGDLIKNDEYVNGGWGDVSTITGTDFGDAGMPVLDGECAMHHQASFYAGFWPEETEIAEDGDVYAFITPGVDEGANAVTGGGELVGAFNESEAITAVQTFLSSSEWANLRVSLGGVISANNGVDPANAESSGQLLVDAIGTLQDPETTFRFDGSDLMPGAVGAGTFWKAMVDWISGEDSEKVLGEVESSWN
ncbi:alpha-glucoside transport system substrate-binding protein [Zhihengliuella flava]|uniref:Alpha-glucoside transport system substrate-binding protein n=2 Tax=Zhihengliuella flava TaxID=1285193 RepID=A0A931DB09_9MICC|nr:alpha-glucoside transport system substrate-binding protein [Zhihengliuella flava]